MLQRHLENPATNGCRPWLIEPDDVDKGCSLQSQAIVTYVTSTELPCDFLAIFQ